MCEHLTIYTQKSLVVCSPYNFRFDKPTVRISSSSLVSIRFDSTKTTKYKGKGWCSRSIAFVSNTYRFHLSIRGIESKATHTQKTKPILHTRRWATQHCTMCVCLCRWLIWNIPRHMDIYEGDFGGFTIKYRMHRGTATYIPQRLRLNIESN